MDGTRKLQDYCSSRLEPNVLSNNFVKPSNLETLGHNITTDPALIIKAQVLRENVRSTVFTRPGEEKKN